MGSSSEDGPVVVLTIEDSPMEIRLLSEAFDEQDRAVTHLVATDGVEAFDILSHRGIYTDSPAPDLVVLDLDLPGRSGREIIAELRDLEEFRALPVVVFSSSDDPETIRDCYLRGANAYIVKPTDYDAMLTIVEQLLGFWVDTAELMPN